MENNYASTYRRIMSSTAIFGGAQALSVFVNIIRAKLVASILHSRGMGMSSVITNAANGLQQLSLLGLKYTPTIITSSHILFCHNSLLHRYYAYFYNNSSIKHILHFLLPFFYHTGMMLPVISFCIIIDSNKKNLITITG